MKQLNLGPKIRVYQWLIGYRIGVVMQYKVTSRSYRCVEDVLMHEVTSITDNIKKLKSSGYTVYEKEYIRGLKKYSRDPEYSRQIHHSGGLEGHSFNR